MLTHGHQHMVSRLLLRGDQLRPPRGVPWQGSDAGENPERQNSITPPITFKLPNRHCVFGPPQCWPGRSQIFLRGPKIGLRGRRAASRLSIGDERRRTFCPGKIFFLARPPRPLLSCWVCTSSISGLRKYFGHQRHTSLPNIERRGARGAAGQVRFGKLNVIGVVVCVWKQVESAGS